MKNRLLLVLVLSLLVMGNAFSQEKGQLFRYDDKAFEDVVKEKLKDTGLPPLVVPWTKEVLRSYCGEESAKVGFTAEDYQRALDSLDFYRKQYQQAKEDKAGVEKELADVTFERDTLQKARTRISFEKSTLESQLKLFSNIDDVLAQKRDSIRMLKGDVERLQKEIETLGHLNEEVLGLRIRNQELKDSLQSANDELSSLNDRLVAKGRENEALREELGKLKTANQRFNQAFAETEETINKAYSENVGKSILDMNASQLGAAKSAFDGMRPLLAIDPEMLNDLEGKVNEMNEWASLIGPLSEASDYLKEKYNEDRRTALIKKIRNLTVIGSKATNDKNDMLTLLENEQKIKEYFDNIISNLRDMQCLPDETALRKALDMLNRMKGYAAKYYRVGVYSSYDEAIDIIEMELQKSPPSADVKTDSNFEKFITKQENKF